MTLANGGSARLVGIPRSSFTQENGTVKVAKPLQRVRTEKTPTDWKSSGKFDTSVVSKTTDLAA